MLWNFCLHAIRDLWIIPWGGSIQIWHSCYSHHEGMHVRNLLGQKNFLMKQCVNERRISMKLIFHREIPCGIQTYFCISLWSKNLFIFGFLSCTSMWHPKSTLILPSQLKYLPLLGHLPLRHISDLSLYSFCQSPNKIFLKMYSEPNMVEACMSPSGQLLNAVWSHCLSCLNEIRGLSRQASPWQV